MALRHPEVTADVAQWSDPADRAHEARARSLARHVARTRRGARAPGAGWRRSSAGWMTREDGWVPSVAVVVPAGGRASRLDGSKLAADVGGMTLLDRTLDGLPPDALVVCVGPEVFDDQVGPLGGGPHAVRRTADRCRAGSAPSRPDVRTVVLVGADMPEAGRAVADLLAAAATLDGAGGGLRGARRQHRTSPTTALRLAVELRFTVGSTHSRRPRDGRCPPCSTG